MSNAMRLLSPNSKIPRYDFLLTEFRVSEVVIGTTHDENRRHSKGRRGKKIKGKLK
jgi:hypothetical protein